MKKFFFYAAAAIVALASCSKTQVVYNDAPQEIGFKAVTGAMTKAESEEPTTLSGNIDMGVFAFVNDGKAPYFSNIKFTANNNVWTGEPEQYWPLQSSLDFVVYAPHGNVDNGYKASYADADKVLTVANCDNSVNVTEGVADIEDQTDYLYGAEYYDGADEKKEDGTTTAIGYKSGPVATSLKHALAKITINFTGSNVTVNSVSLAAPHMKGTYTVDYSNPTNPEINWTSRTAWSNGNDILLQLKQTGDVLAEAVKDESENVIMAAKTATASIMVVPADDSNILIKYTIKGTDDILDAEIPLTGTWASGTHYIYNIKISPNAIEFSAPTVADWAGGAASNPTIQ